MNQLYHPSHTAAFFTMLAQNRDIPVFTITNNVVDDLTTFADAEKKVKTMDGVMKFLASNRSDVVHGVSTFVIGLLHSKSVEAKPLGSKCAAARRVHAVKCGMLRRLDGDFVRKLANAHYTSQYNPPRKAFDFYAAAALVHFMTSKDLLGLPHSLLFYSGDYGLSLVGKSDTWEATLKSYVSRIDTKVDPGDSDFIKTKKEYFQREISVMSTIENLPKLTVLMF